MTLFLKIKSVIQLATVIFSLLTNFVSIYLVVNHSPSKIGNYKVLMIYFSIMSMVYAILDYLVQPYIHSYGAAFGMYMDLRGTIFEEYRIIPFLLVAALRGSFCSTIYAIAINFIYRFFALEREGRLRYFSGKRLLTWIFIPIVSAVLWVSNNSIWLSPNPELNDYMRNRTREKYELDIDRTSYTACLYWRIDQNGNQILSWKDMIGALGLYHMMTIPFVTIVYFGIKSYWKIKEILKQGESEYSKRLQIQLYKALVAQTLIPMTFLFFPIGIFLISPLIGIDIEWASLPITFLYAFYPAVDPIPNMIFIEEYRLAVHNWIRRLLRKNQVASVVSYELTTDVV
ncbi:Protein CBG10439 [Caenorhabditis briggsae]|uniref:Serpentine receptor class r-10 n=1 Tax=Caenorhabditis briggsae TaxID=6238 RepID=A8XB79_CAEBR|nr:Protein CBG10439 [Caenorhabditis briggsae]CAP29859.1 Protein CBG10439 [Caenorhabditis briggsae]